MAGEKLSWEGVYKLCVTLADMVLLDKQKPGLIVTLDKDSWPVGRILCDLLGVKTLLHLGNSETCLEETIKKLKPGKTLLSVTRAESLGKADIQAITRVFPGLKVAALVSSVKTDWKPDYVGKTVRSHLAMPWEE